MANVYPFTIPQRTPFYEPPDRVVSRFDRVHVVKKSEIRERYETLTLRCGRIFFAHYFRPYNDDLHRGIEQCGVCFG